MAAASWKIEELLGLRQRIGGALSRAQGYIRSRFQYKGEGKSGWCQSLETSKPPSVSGTANAIISLKACGERENSPQMSAGKALILAKAREDGGWGTSDSSDECSFARVTYLALLALLETGEPYESPKVQRGVEWFERAQNADHGWGIIPGEKSDTTSTAYALKALTAYPGREREFGDAIKRGRDWLKNNQNNDSSWGAHPDEPGELAYTADATMALLACGERKGAAIFLRAIDWMVQCKDAKEQLSETYACKIEGRSIESYWTSPQKELMVQSLLRLGVGVETDALAAAAITIMNRQNPQGFWEVSSFPNSQPLWAIKEAVVSLGPLSERLQSQDLMLRLLSMQAERSVVPSSPPRFPEMHVPERPGSGEKQWDVFISYASEDKGFVEPLSQELIARGLEVWYDRLELKVGDPVQTSIDEALAQSRFGVVIASQNYFAKSWPKKELNALAAMETNGLKVILPVLHGLDRAALAKHSPALAGLVAAHSSDGIPEVVRHLLRAIRSNRAGEPRVYKDAEAERLKAEMLLEQENVSKTVDRLEAISGILLFHVRTSPSNRTAGELVPIFILRSGLSLLRPYKAVFPSSPLGILMPSRSERTANPEICYGDIPRKPSHGRYLLLDLIIDSGATVRVALQALKDRAGEGFDSANAPLVVAPFSSESGNRAILSAFPEVEIHTLWGNMVSRNNKLVDLKFDAGDYALGGGSGNRIKWE